MTQFLPANLLALFAAREPIKYLPPPDKLPHEKKTRGYVGVGAFLDQFEDPKDTPPPTRVETKEERIERRRREKAEQVAYKLEREIALWDPNSIENTTEDPFKTLFVARINYDTSESKLRREFEVYGPIKKIILIHNENNRARGYAFIEYEHERDMHSAYKHADGKKIDGRRVLVDVERARTVKGWLPRRLGGGLGGTRRGGNEVNIKHSGREDNVREKERYRMEREREERRDDRSVGFERKRSRSRDKRSRSKERRRYRSRGEEEQPERYEKRERREKSRERKRRREGRSKSREKERSERKRDKRDRSRSRDRRRDKDKKERKPDFDIKIKEEPIDDYPDYSQNDYSQYAGQVKYESGDEQKYRPSEQDQDNGYSYR
ncbi:U1 small nuclear ribonucleoprotein 70 kDa isoform X1 [Chironomus tepperi]|uniref:U1 small nuclear ribonucleoprotein 70 kDa isoform X1 n=1 Tax=Chironomus tepperi TaxID=113505 RepID=UPI00391FBC04